MRFTETARTLGSSLASWCGMSEAQVLLLMLDLGPYETHEEQLPVVDGTSYR